MSGRRAELLAPFDAPPPGTSAAGAAVLIVLRESPRGVETLLMERTVRAEDRASGQVSLPGGRVAPEDDSLVTTALRETREEVGLSPSDLTPPQFISVESASVFALRVAVFAAGLAEGAGKPREADPQEVAQLFWLPESTLSVVNRVTRPTVTGERVVDAATYDGHVVWGFTYRVLRQFFASAPRVPPA